MRWEEKCNNGQLDDEWVMIMNEKYKINWVYVRKRGEGSQPEINESTQMSQRSGWVVEMPDNNGENTTSIFTIFKLL